MKTLLRSLGKTGFLFGVVAFSAVGCGEDPAPNTEAGGGTAGSAGSASGASGVSGTGGTGGGASGASGASGTSTGGMSGTAGTPSGGSAGSPTGGSSGTGAGTGGSSSGTGGGGGAGTGGGAGDGGKAGGGGKAGSGPGGGGGKAGGGGSGGGANLTMICMDPAYQPTGTGSFMDADFCTYYTQVCGAMAPVCTDYNMAMMTVKHCRSEHLCNAVEAGTNQQMVTLHCGHAAGMTPCND